MGSNPALLSLDPLSGVSIIDPDLRDDRVLQEHPARTLRCRRDRWLPAHEDAFEHRNTALATHRLTDDDQKIEILVCLFVTGQRVLACGFAGHDGDIFLAENGGQDWRTVLVIGHQLYDLFFLDERSGWAGSQRGNTWRTRDGGETCAEISPYTLEQHPQSRVRGVGKGQS